MGRRINTQSTQANTRKFSIFNVSRNAKKQSAREELTGNDLWEWQLVLKRTKKKGKKEKLKKCIDS